MVTEQINWLILQAQQDIAKGEDLLAKFGDVMPQRIRDRLLLAKAELQVSLEHLYEALAERSLYQKQETH